MHGASEVILATAQLVLALSTFAGVIAGVMYSRHNGKKIDEVRHATNGLTSQLVDTAKDEAYARGKRDAHADLITSNKLD